MTEPVNLYISIPSNRPWQPRFGSCFADLLVRLATEGIKASGYELGTFRYQVLRQASNLPNARQYFVDDMLKGVVVNGEQQKFTHWLSLDDDMTFPTNIVDQLISNGKDIVSCNAMRKDGTIDGSCTSFEQRPIDSTGKAGLQEIRTMGGAIFLAKIDAFRNIPKPHFQMIWSPEHNACLGEDVYFSGLLRVNGVKLYADHDASKTITHIGEHEYQWEATKTVTIYNLDIEREKQRSVA